MGRRQGSLGRRRNLSHAERYVPAHRGAAGVVGAFLGTLESSGARELWTSTSTRRPAEVQVGGMGYVTRCRARNCREWATTVLRKTNTVGGLGWPPRPSRGRWNLSSGRHRTDAAARGAFRELLLRARNSMAEIRRRQKNFFLCRFRADAN